MASKQPPGYQPLDERKSLVEEADALNRVVAKLSVLGDFIKSMDNDTFLLAPNTPLGLYLIMEDCIDTLKKLGGLED